MDVVMLQFQDLGMGLVLGLSAAGSAAGAGVAGMAAVGAWKKKYSQNKQASFMLLAFVGAPLTQTIYGKIVMNRIYLIISIISRLYKIHATKEKSGNRPFFPSWLARERLP